MSAVVMAARSEWWSGPCIDAHQAKTLAGTGQGITVDPPKLAAALAEGVSLEELYQRSRAGEYQPAAPYDLRLPV